MNKRINVHHVTRVEGHGNILVEVTDGQLKECKLEIIETPRFFEAMLLGRPYLEASHITSRICGICATGHANTSLRASEKALGIQISEQTDLLRKLTLHGEILDSHIETKNVAYQANALGRFDAVIHNAGVYQAPPREIFMVNTIAPYILTCLIQKPKRLIYLSSSMHLQGRANLENFKQDNHRISYSHSKLYVLMVCMAAARKWSGVHANAVDPGWVPTKMGGQGAPDDLQKRYETQTWLAVSNDSRANVSGRYFHHQTERRYNPQAGDVMLQERFLSLCGDTTGIPFPQ